MNSKRQQALDILARLGAHPAVAFWEARVAWAIKSILQELEISFQADPYGNIIARLPGHDPATVPLALVAHMDHPGFEAVGTEDNCLIGRALGGVPAASFEDGVPLQLVLGDGTRIPATSVGRYGEENDRQILIQPAETLPKLPCQVVFDLADFELEDQIIHMRAADDLAGCASILAALAVLGAQPTAGDVYGVFTRAEEVGLIGARLLAESGTLPNHSLIVSLESSRTLPGAEIGSGPVIRVGDAGQTFSADAEAVLVRAKETLQTDSTGFKVQRQLMSGGLCEASAFAHYGYRVTGIAFPLANYHNGSPEGGIEAEYINIDDYMGGIQLMVESARRVGERENTNFSQRMRQVPEDLRDRLKNTAD